MAKNRASECRPMRIGELPKYMRGL